MPDKEPIADVSSAPIEPDAGVSLTVPRADELSEEQLAEFGRRYLLVCLIERGKNVRQAVAHMQAVDPKFHQSLRWAQNIYSRYKQLGAKGLLDGRAHNKNQKAVLSPAVKQRTLAWWYARPGAHIKVIWRKVTEECREKGEPLPSYDSIRKFLSALPQHEKLLRAGKIAVWDKQGRPVVRYDITSYSNERWQLDNSYLKIYVRELVGTEWKIAEVWLTLFLDAHSRAIPGLQLSSKVPDSWSTALLLRHAILPKENLAWLNKGLPQVIQPDRGPDFMSHAVAATLAYLGVVIDPDPPYYPNRKGKIERFFRTLDEGCLRILPGHMSSGAFSNPTTAQKNVHLLLTRAQLLKEIERFIVHEYHQREHSETGRKPIELWQETVRLRKPVSEADLDGLLLKSDHVRRVRNTGIDFHIPGKSAAERRGGRYWSPDLTYHWSREVRLRYNPEDLESVRVYCASTGEFLCEAWLMGQDESKYTVTDIKRNRNQFRKGLIERQKDYAEEIHKQDRRMARADWNDARALAAELAPTAPEPDEVDMDDVADLLARFEQEDRGGK